MIAPFCSGSVPSSCAHITHGTRPPCAKVRSWWEVTVHSSSLSPAAVSISQPWPFLPPEVKHAAKLLRKLLWCSDVTTAQVRTLGHRGRLLLGRAELPIHQGPVTLWSSDGPLQPPFHDGHTQMKTNKEPLNYPCCRGPDWLNLVPTLLLRFQPRQSCSVGHRASFLCLPNTLPSHTSSPHVLHLVPDSQVKEAECFGESATRFPAMFI